MLFTQQANVGALLETESLEAVEVIGQGGKRYPPLDRETVKTIFPFLAANDACVGVEKSKQYLRLQRTAWGQHPFWRCPFEGKHHEATYLFWRCGGCNVPMVI